MSPRDYKIIKEMGCKHNTPHFILYVLKNDKFRSRLGITVSRHVGNAVVRNRLKRYLKEYFRHNKYKFYDFDYSFIARRSSRYLSYNDIDKEITLIIDRIVYK